MNEPIYLDNNATTRVDPRVLDRVMETMTRDYGNPSSPHSLGKRAAGILDHGRQVIADMINCQPEEIYFFSGGTEANNSAVRGAAEATLFRKPDKGLPSGLPPRGDSPGSVIFSSIEHPCVKGIYFKYLSSQGFGGGPVQCQSDGAVRVESYAGVLDALDHQGVALISLMHSNNETGVIQPVQELGQLCEQRGITFHSDGVQGFGKVPIDVQKLKLSMFGASSHKIYGPKGAGFLYIRRGTPFIPTFFGGHQQGGIRVGTEAMPALAGFIRACEIAAETLQEEAQRIEALRNRFEEILLNLLPRAAVNGRRHGRIPGTTNIRFPGVPARDLIPALDREGVIASAGSACANSRIQKNSASPVLTAMGLSLEEAMCSVRFSFGRFNTLEEAGRAARLTARVAIERGGK